VAEGLEILNSAQRPGIKSLAKVARMTPGQLSAESIAFGLGPRINAAGRLAHAYDAARLLAVNNSIQADKFAAQLDQLNRERQRITADLSAKAEAMVAPGVPIIIAADPDFVSGVVGLVASRLADVHYRPAIVIEKGEDESRGSCRSIPEFHVTEALDEVADLLVRHGGHAQAAGFTVTNENLDEFMSQMTAIAAEKLSGLDLHPTITIDAEIELTEIDWALYESLEPLEPTGYANPTPVFMSRNVEVRSHRVVGQDGTHLQMFLSGGKQDDHYQEMASIAFRQGAWADQLPQYVDIVYTVNVNEWRGRRTLQLMIQDIQAAEMETAVTPS
jgi:single-stranded-DNA-specific exonuclease